MENEKERKMIATGESRIVEVRAGAVKVHWFSCPKCGQRKATSTGIVPECKECGTTQINMALETEKINKSKGISYHMTANHEYFCDFCGFTSVVETDQYWHYEAKHKVKEAN